jgi:hypothetical protein
VVDGEVVEAIDPDDLIEARTGERLSFCRSPQVHTEGVVGPHDLGFEIFAVVLALRIFAFHRSLISRT